MKPLAGKVVLITGASRGIGAELVKAFARKGARLALAARSAGDLETVTKEAEAAGAMAAAFPADVSDLASLRALEKDVVAKFGPIDVLVNNAGIENPWDFETETFENMENVIATNVIGLMWLTRLVVPSMIERRSGHVCNISSVAGLSGVPHNAVYSASKHAVVGFSRSLRAELHEHGVEVSVVCPSFVDGGMFAQWGRKAPSVAPAVSLGQVADGVLKAVEGNRAEVVVAKGLGKIGDVFVAAFPEMTRKTMKRIGVTGFLAEQARINAERRAR